MNASSTLVVFLQTSICLSAALAICAIARKSSSVRLLVSQIAIVVSALFMIAGSWLNLSYTPMVTVKVPEFVAVVVPSRDAVKPVQQNARPEKAQTQKQISTSTQIPPFVSSAPAMSFEPLPWTYVVPVVYGFGLVASLVPMLLGANWIRKTRRNSQQVTKGQTFDVLTGVAERTRIRLPELYTSSTITIPFVTGLFRKQVFVPIDWTEGHCEISCSAVIEHEVAHIVSRDLEWKFLCRVACALVWFQPLTWLLFRVMSNASEELCDQSVLASGVASTTYANTLLEIREKANRSNVPGLVIGAVSRESNLAKRMKLILATDPKRIRRASRIVLWFAVFCFAFAAATSTFVFGQRERSEVSPFATRAQAGAIALVDYRYQPIKGAKAWLLVGFGNENLPELRPLEVIGNQAMVTEQALDKSRMSTLVVKTPEGQVDSLRIGPTKEKFTQFNLSKPSTVRGQILMPSGIKASQRLMVVSVTKKDPEWTGVLPLFMFKEIAPTTTLSGDGYFEMTGFPAGSKVRFQVDDDRIAQDWTTMEVEIDANGKSSFFRHQAHLGSTIQGRVLRNGKPVPGINVVAQGQTNRGWGQATSDANGEYRISRLEPEKFNVAAQLVKAQRDEFTAFANEGVVTQYGEVKDGINLLLIRGGTISGTLVDTKGTPVTDGQIGIFGQAYPASTGMVGVEVTDAQGHFEARVPPGDNQVYYMGPDGMSKPILVHVSPDKDSKVTLQKPDPKIQHERKFLEVQALWKGSMADSSILLKDGSRARLLYLCQGKGDDVKIWWPEGNLRTDEEYQQDLAAIDYESMRMQKTGGTIFARIRVDGRPNESNNYVFKSDFSGMWSPTPVTTPLGEHRSEILLSLLPKGQSIINLKMGVPLGQYMNLGNYKVTYAGKGAPGAVFRVTRSQGDIQQINLILPKIYAGKDLRMKAFDKNGKSISLASMSMSSSPLADKMTERDFGFHGPNKIQRVEVSYRDVQWIEFKDIHMKPVTQ